jgi:hypothetical protein
MTPLPEELATAAMRPRIAGRSDMPPVTAGATRPAPARCVPRRVSLGL